MTDQPIYQAMQARLEDGRLPCAQAFLLVRTLAVEPLAVGEAADAAGVRISRCQLGLFGYGPKAAGKHKIVHAADSVPEHLAAEIRANACEHGITCAALWQVAHHLGISRLEAASAVEAMGLRVTVCQLGCFPRPLSPGVSD